MRTIICTLVILAIPLLSLSGNITQEQAATVARNFYFERINLVKTVSINDINVLQSRIYGNDPVVYYVCDMQPEGFVVVSASNKVIPVLAYSFESRFANDSEIPAGFNTWMDHYRQQIEYAILSNIVPESKITGEWQRLLSIGFAPDDNLKSVLSVSPLLVSKWNQDSPYNLWCPPDPAGPGGHCYAGCVATAMGQLLYYYRFPQQGQSSYSYTHPDYGIISADFGATTYKWDGMPSTINKANDPIDELLFHQGVSVDMDYGPDGSGMWNHKAAYSLKTHFRYGPETQYYFRDSVTLDWDSLLITNLDQRKPLYYAGWAGVQSNSGHAFVCDGYQPGNYYHFNWGWGGSQDGYFYTANLTPGGNNFNFAQEVIPMFPDTIQNTYPAYCQGTTTLNGLRGSVEDGSGWYNYQNNSNCTWLIVPQDAEYDSIKSIRITFLRFDTEPGADTLYIYNGVDESAPLLGAFTGSSIPGIITSSGNKVFIKFRTNSSITKGGWQFDYESIFPVYCTGTTTLTASSGTIEDGSGTKKYSNNSVCRWKIQPADGLPVIFSFTSFETFDSLDFVKIYDLTSQEVLGTFSGDQLPPSVIALSGKMMIQFMTNGSGNAEGWSGEFHSSLLGTKDIDSCMNETLIYPNPANENISIEKFFTSVHDQKVHIRIVDLNAKTVLAETIKISTGQNKIMLNIKSLPKAAYFLIIGDGKQEEMHKIVIN